MNPILKADRAALSLTDAGVLWLWDEVGVSWRVAVHVATVAYLLSFWIAIARADGGAPGLFDIATFGLVMLFMGLQLAQIHRLGDAMQSVINLLSRDGPLSRIARMVCIVVTVAFAALSLAGAQSWLWALTMALCVVRTYIGLAVIPQGPRRRRFALQLARAGGAA